jgi:hypothetical protein
MTKLRLVVGLCVLLVPAALSSSVGAANGPTVCSGHGTVAAGTYDALMVTGNCTFADGTITVNGNLTVAPGAILNDHAQAMATTVHVKGNVIVGKGGVVGLGNYDPTPPHTSAVVDGNVNANGAATLYLGGMTVHGNITVTGGGDAGRNLPLKDDTVDGNITVTGWSGLWFGIVRDTVGGNVTLNGNVAADPTTLPGSDSSEVVTNTIGGNLICNRNVPAAQIGDSGGTPNTVRGVKTGQCAGL